MKRLIFTTSESGCLRQAGIADMDACFEVASFADNGRLPTSSIGPTALEEDDWLGRSYRK